MRKGSLWKSQWDLVISIATQLFVTPATRLLVPRKRRSIHQATLLVETFFLAIFDRLFDNGSVQILTSDFRHWTLQKKEK